MAKNLQYVKVFEALQVVKGPVSVSSIKVLKRYRSDPSFHLSVGD